GGREVNGTPVSRRGDPAFRYCTGHRSLSCSSTAFHVRIHYLSRLLMKQVDSRAAEAIERCRQLAQCTTEPGFTTRTFLSGPMKDVHRLLGSWMHEAGMTVSVDAVGNLRGLYASEHSTGRRLLIGSHLDTVRRAGAYDGILGVVLGVALVEALNGRRL